MNQVIRQKWVAALRSGKYQQTTQKLKNHGTNNFCCLGVLCDIHRKIVLKKGVDKVWKHSPNLPHKDLYNDEGSILPYNVQKWAGLKSYNGPFDKEDGTRTCLSEQNDKGLTFSEIADIIEKNPAFN